MAGGTLGFFNRLFSSKKNKGLKQELNVEFYQEDCPSENTTRVSSKEGEENCGYKKIESTIKTSGNINNLESGRGLETYGENESSSQLYSTDRGESRIDEGRHDAVNIVSSAAMATAVEDDSGAEEAVNDERHPVSREQDNDQISDNSLSSDYALENDSFTFLSKMEQFTIKLSDNTVQKSSPLVIEYLVGIANGVVEFAGQLPINDQKKPSLKTLFGRDEKSYKVLSHKLVENDRLIIDYSVVVSNNDDPKQAFINLSNDILHLINIYLGVCVKVFKSEQMSEQWKTIYKGFLKTLTESVRGSQANQ